MTFSFSQSYFIFQNLTSSSHFEHTSKSIHF